MRLVGCDTLTGHVIAQRIRFYPDAGFGTADVLYPTLLQQHSLFEAFPLYGLAGRWYANPQNVLADMATLSGLATRPKPFALPSMMDAPAQETSLEEFVSTLKGTGARISIEVSRSRA